MIRITSITRDLETNTWSAIWENGTDSGIFLLMEAEADQLIGYNNFFKRYTEETETWVFKEEPLPAFLTGLIPRTGNE